MKNFIYFEIVVPSEKWGINQKLPNHTLTEGSMHEDQSFVFSFFSASQKSAQIKEIKNKRKQRKQKNQHKKSQKTEAANSRNRNSIFQPKKCKFLKQHNELWDIAIEQRPMAVYLKHNLEKNCLKY